MTHQEKNHKMFLDVLGIVCVILLIATTTISVVALSTAGKTNKNTEQISLNHDGLTNLARTNCFRVNELIKINNGQSSAIYKVLNESLQANSNLRKEQKIIFRSAIDNVLYISRTDCRRAINDPNYKIPGPIPWEEAIDKRLIQKP